jgi:alanine racemase
VSAHRSELTIDLGAVRRNVRTLRRAVEGAALWAVVKADGYGHGALGVARVALEEGAGALCVATVAEALPLRAAFPDARILVMGATGDLAAAREARLELAVGAGRIPEGLPVHLKLDTGMGRWGFSELPAPTRDVVGLMTHFASADCDADFTRTQIERFRAVTDAMPALERHAANSAGALRFAEARFDAVRVGIALYGLSPFGGDPADDGLEPVLSWRSHLAQVKRLRAGDSTGYGRRFVAERETWVGIVPVGYADGFRRDMTGTQVVVDGRRQRVLGTVSMDAVAVELPGEAAVGTDVTLVGDGLLLEEHARVADTINYELACGIGVAAGESRSLRRVVDA